MDLRGDRQGDPRGDDARDGHVPGINLPTTATPANLLSRLEHRGSGYNKVPFALSSATIDEVAILAQDGAYHTP